MKLSIGSIAAKVCLVCGALVSAVTGYLGYELDNLIPGSIWARAIAHNDLDYFHGWTGGYCHRREFDQYNHSGEIRRFVLVST